MSFNVIEEKSRFDYLDLAKGFLIISVVLSHAPFDNAMYIYWFHMPAFFIISGLLAKEKINIKDQAIKFFVPYLAFSIVDLLMSYAGSYDSLSLQGFVDDLSKYIYGGKNVGGVFWFIPCLFLTKIIFNKLRKYLSTKQLIGSIIILYILAHLYTRFIMTYDIGDIPNYLKFPWDIDVLFITIPYYAIGYGFKNITNFITNKYTFIVTAILTFVIYAKDFMGHNYFYINLKFSQYKDPILDLVIPVTITICILSFCSLVSKFDILSPIRYLGKISLIVMYLHKPICSLVEDYVPLNFVQFTVIGVLIPVLIYNLFISKFSITEMIFAGKRLVKSKNNVVDKSIVLNAYK
ncbi:Fucose 4-O-acetylase [Clostridium cavendishii DSM 21758]|uniref:Fucose 4-O-acetylase n=1 Tax=Clostridium cavendishii DSM 21758 TaxID=1121302 RepID=A0A1M6THL7_9CLOT|nr:acyltransferase family protein [Clostridium cavendishii]SHK56485.1 Fucose 4-O-acetylase [Clostridium cavendishii DSM 21758]